MKSKSIKTEKVDGTLQLAEALDTPMATFLAAEALAKTTFPREVGEDAVRRLHGLSHQQAIYLAQDAHPYVAKMSGRELYAFELGQEKALGLEQE